MKYFIPIQLGLYRFMTITVFQLAIATTCSILVHAHDISGQELLEKKVSIEAKHERVKSILSKIEKQASVTFSYNAMILRNKSQVTFSSDSMTIAEALNSIFGSSVSFEVIKRQILLKPSKISMTEEDNDPFAVTINGTVTDETGQAVPGVNVIEKGTTNGTTTDGDGKYTISLQNDNAILLFSFIGYTTQEVQTSESVTLLNITLVTDVKSLDEVVIVGYGSQSERQVTGAVGSVTGKEIGGVAVTGLDQALQGKMAGVQVTQNSGEPGGNVSVRIRGLGSLNGSNEPLYIVDGVPYGSLNAINPNDIERIDVLKDAASAAIYGSRGSNGVVIITTKRAKAGNIQVNVDAYAGTQSAYRTLPLLNGQQFAQLANDNLINGGQAPNPAWSNPSTVPNTDWQNELLKTAPIQNYNVSVSGGSEKSRSLVSIGYFDQGGIVAQSYYKRYTARINTDYDITSRFKVGLTVNAAFEEKRGTQTDGGNASNNQGGLITAAVSQPTIPLTTAQDGPFSIRPDGSIDPTGSVYYGYDGTAFVTNSADTKFYPAGLSNPVYAYEKLRENTNNSQQFLAAAFGEYEIISGLKVRSAINLTMGINSDERFWQSVPVQQLSGRGLYGTGSIYSEGANNSNQWNWINTVTYSKTINNHNLAAVVGIDALKSTSQGYNVQTSNNPNDQPFIDGSLQGDRVVSGGAPTEFALLSYLGRISYDYAGKYLVTATIRRDGSSNFNPSDEYQYGVFPSASAGWMISEENFLRPITFISQLKLRASYGTVGNQGIPPFQYVSTYDNEGNRRRYPLGTNQDLRVGYYPRTIGTSDIRWEKSTQTNIGIDAAFFDNSLSLTADYYVKTIDDMLGNFPVPAYMGVPGNSILRNGFSMQNSGIELTLGYNRTIGEVSFSTSANFTTLNNKVTKLTDNETGFIASDISAGADGGAFTRTEVGERVANFYGYVADGIFQNQDEVEASGMLNVMPGDRRYKDLNNDGVIDDKDRAVIGNGLPKSTFGLTMNVDYKGFSLSVLLNGQAGVQIANQTKYWLNNMKYDNSQGGISNGSTDLLESWTGEGSTNTFTRNSWDAALSNKFFSTFNIEDAAFLRVRNVQLAYTLPQSISQKVGMTRTRIYIAAQNLFTFTSYSGYDPETGSRVQNGRGNALQTGVDFGRYPVSRMFIGGINLQF